MKINLAREKAVYRDSGLTLTEAQAASLTDGNTTSSGISITAGNTLSVVCDLGARYDLSEIKYYRTLATVGTIKMEGKQTTVDSWDTFTSSGTSSTIATLSGVNKYRFIRLTHSVTTGTASAIELEINSDDTQIRAGSHEQGDVSQYSIDTGTNELTPLAIQIRNDDSVPHNYYVLLDPSDVDSLDYALASGIGGPYYPLRSGGVNFPMHFAWSSGSLTNTSIVSNKVRSTTTSGTYYSPVLDIGGLEGRRLFWKSTLSGTNEIDVDSRVDSQATIEIRMSNTRPSSPWVSGQLSTDSLWSVTSGTLPWSVASNDLILDPSYKRYFQARVEFHSTTGQSALLETLGIENGFKVHVEPHSYAPVYVRSISQKKNKGKNAAVLYWYFEDRDTE